MMDGVFWLFIFGLPQDFIINYYCYYIPSEIPICFTSTGSHSERHPNTLNASEIRVISRARISKRKFHVTHHVPSTESFTAGLSSATRA